MSASQLRTFEKIYLFGQSKVLSLCLSRFRSVSIHAEYFFMLSPCSGYIPVTNEHKLLNKIDLAINKYDEVHAKADKSEKLAISRCAQLGNMHAVLMNNTQSNNVLV